MALQEKQLGQSRPANTLAASIYSPGAGVTAIIKTITVCNVTNTPAAFSIYLDDDGATYNQSTALFYEVNVDGNSTVLVEGFWAMNNSSGNLAVQTDTASSLTFTICGAEVT